MGCGKVKIDTSDFFAWKEGKGEVVPLDIKIKKREHVLQPLEHTLDAVRKPSKPLNFTVKFLSPEVSRMARDETKKVRHERWERQKEEWAKAKQDHREWEERCRREKEERERRNEILMFRDEKGGWDSYFLRGLCVFKGKAFDLINKKKCQLCLTPIPSYMCSYSYYLGRRRVWDRFLYHDLHWGDQPCFYESCLFFSDKVEHKCSVSWPKVLNDVCENNRCRHLYHWWYTGKMQDTIGGVKYDSLSFEERGLFILVKYLWYLLTNKEEREKWQKKRVMWKQRMIQKA